MLSTEESLDSYFKEEAIRDGGSDVAKSQSNGVLEKITDLRITSQKYFQ